MKMNKKEIYFLIKLMLAYVAGVVIATVILVAMLKVTSHLIK
jgi:hypothetical protein